MPTTNQPNIGLHAGWTANEANWGDKMNANLRAIDTLMQSRVLSSALDTPPGGAAEGDAYVIPSSASGAWSGQASKIARWSVAGMVAPGWEYYTPKVGWIVWDILAALPMRYTATGWESGLTTIAGVAGLSGALIAKAPSEVPVVNSVTSTLTFALEHAGAVVRQSNAAAITDTIPDNATVEFKVGAVISIRQVAAGQITITPASGVVLNIPTGFVAKTRAQGSVILVHKVSLNTWDLTGDAASA